MSALAIPAAAPQHEIPKNEPSVITQQAEESRVAFKSAIAKPVKVPTTAKFTLDRAHLTSKPAPPPPPKPKPKPVVKEVQKEVSKTVTKTTTKTSPKSTVKSSPKSSPKTYTKKSVAKQPTKKTSVPAPIVKVSPGTAKGEAQSQMKRYGWGSDQLSCLVKLWEKESNWKHTAENPSSGAYGIPQSLPGSKMASAGSDWRTNPATQIKWGLGYISDRYGSPCKAWGHSQAIGWY